MGKAALDLPDPLQAPPEGAKTSTDDLLAQLAGDEIDRLLAEADGAQPPAARTPFHIAPPTGPEKDREPAPAAAAPQQQPVPPAPSSTEQDVAAEMHALFSAAVAKDEADAALAAAATQAEAETSAAERDGLEVPAAINIPGRPDARPAIVEEDVPLPLYLRPLEWLNAPLAILPESVRDVIGRVAIITLINAAVILAYVLIVRRG